MHEIYYTKQYFIAYLKFQFMFKCNFFVPPKSGNPTSQWILLIFSCSAYSMTIGAVCGLIVPVPNKWVHKQ